MKKNILIYGLMVFLLIVLSACAKAEPTAPVEAPAEQATTAPTEAPVEPSAPAAEQQTEAPALQQPTPAAPTVEGRELLESRCVTCHSLDKVTTHTGTAEEWDVIVTRMVNRGADLTDAEKNILIQYLADTYKK